MVADDAGPMQMATAVAETAPVAGGLERSLQGVEVIRLDCEQIDLLVEGGASLSAAVRLSGAAGEHAPELHQEGGVLVLYQRGRHAPEAGGAPILYLPLEGCPPIQGQVQAGRPLELRQVNAEISLTKGAGGVHVQGGTGAFNLNKGSGPAAIAGRRGPIALNGGSGGVEFTRCTGPIHVNQGSGGVRLAECAGQAAINSGSGGVTLDRPQAQDVNVNTGSGGIHIQGGSLSGLKANTASGGIASTARLVIEEQRDTARFDIQAGSGNVGFDLPQDVPVRVEVVVREGEVVSDVALVSVGLPGQSGGARRYVGVANAPAAGGPPSRRIDLRLKTEKGNVDLRLPGASGAVRQRLGPGRADRQEAGRDEEVRVILDALERREISVAQAEALLAAVGS